MIPSFSKPSNKNQSNAFFWEIQESARVQFCYNSTGDILNLKFKQQWESISSGKISTFKALNLNCMSGTQQDKNVSTGSREATSKELMSV